MFLLQLQKLRLLRSYIIKSSVYGQIKIIKKRDVMRYGDMDVIL